MTLEVSPTWTILIATIGRRRNTFECLLQQLLPQTTDYHGHVTVTALWNNGERPLADVRQQLVDSATAAYVSFIDDDDDVPDYFVENVMNELSSGPDQVGWRMQCVLDGVALKPTYHSVRYSGWFEDDHGYYRDVSHLNPVRRELAMQCDFRRGEPPEDVAWVDQLRALVKTERYVDDVMYYYHASSSDSTWRPGSVQPTQLPRLEVDHPYFRYHPWSYQ